MLVCILYSGMPAWAQASHQPLFDSAETASTNLSPFPKWSTVRQRFQQTIAGSGLCRSAEESPRCRWKTWQTFLESKRNLPVLEKLSAVNRALNEAEYTQDIDNWGVNDYWATPVEFFYKHGDCEDYAIAKFYSLRAIGVPPQDMRIVILNDLNLSAMHAVLAVFVDGVPYILDNQLAQVVKASSIHHYFPIYSINEYGWWRHRPM